MSITKKIDFALLIKAKNCNPNGDPLDGNRPRITYDGKGEISDVALKRKIRDRLQERGEKIFVQSNEKRDDDHKSLKSRFDELKISKKDKKDKKDKIDNALQKSKACERWYDVRAFGQVFAFGGSDDKESVSIAVRGPVSIHPAFSTEEVVVFSQQITKSTNADGDADKKKSPDTMGMKHRIDGEYYYLSYGSINYQLSTKTGFNDQDTATLKAVLQSLFENDASSARPEGSMEVHKLIWWEHNSPHGQYSSAKVHRSLKIKENGDVEFDKLEGLKAEILEESPLR